MVITAGAWVAGQRGPVGPHPRGRFTMLHRMLALIKPRFAHGSHQAALAFQFGRECADGIGLQGKIVVAPVAPVLFTGGEVVDLVNLLVREHRCVSCKAFVCA